MLRYDRQTKPGLVALYDIRPGNGVGPFLQPRSPHGAYTHAQLIYGWNWIIDYDGHNSKQICNQIHITTPAQNTTNSDFSPVQQPPTHTVSVLTAIFQVNQG